MPRQIDRAAFAIGTGIALDDVADIENVVRFAQIAPPIHARQVEPSLIGAADEVAHLRTVRSAMMGMPSSMPTGPI
jgi:hypothetical protein